MQLATPIIGLHLNNSGLVPIKILDLYVVI